jgi:hypothetical protein
MQSCHWCLSQYCHLFMGWGFAQMVLRIYISLVLHSKGARLHCPALHVSLHHCMPPAH